MMQSFVLPANGAATPESIARKRKLVELMMREGSQTGPIGHWSQGAARMVNALMGGIAMNRADKAEGEGRKSASEALARALSGDMGSAPSQQDPNGAMMEAINNPWQSPQGSAMAMDAWQKANTPVDPMEAQRKQLELQKLEAEIGQMSSGGKPTDDMREYEFAKSQGFPGTFQDYMVAMRKAGATSVDARQMGTIPPGYQVDYDEQGRPVKMVPIPGSPADLESQAAQAAKGNRETAEQSRADIVTQDIDRALGLMDGGILPDTGIGAMLSGVPGTDARGVSALLDTVRANIGFQELNNMRQQSPTGGALGQVTERELAFLQNVAGSLDQSQSKEQLTDNLNRLWNSYQDVIHGPGNGPPRRPLKFQQGGGNASSSAAQDGWITLPNGVKIKQVQ